MKTIHLPVFEAEGTGAAGAGASKGAPPADGAAPPSLPASGAGAADGDVKPPAPAKTALESGGQDSSSAPPPDFPADWRDKMAGGDKDLRKALDRYQSPADVAKANLDAQKRIRSGKATEDVPMPDPVKNPEEAKAWRAERGIPDDPSGYKIPEDVTSRLLPEDKPILQSFTEFAHKKNLPPAAVAAAAEWYTELQEQMTGQQVERDKVSARETEDALRKEWGNDYKAFSNAAAKFAGEITPGVPWFSARLDDGRRLGDIPEVVKALADLSLLKYGDVSFVGGEAIKTAESRYTELDTKLKETGALSDAENKELFALIEAREKRAKRG